ncbi:hypothetical protein THAOC_22547, partial [Thalassiosira oceanica]
AGAERPEQRRRGQVGRTAVGRDARGEADGDAREGAGEGPPKGHRAVHRAAGRAERGAVQRRDTDEPVRERQQEEVRAGVDTAQAAAREEDARLAGDHLEDERAPFDQQDVQREDVEQGAARDLPRGEPRRAPEHEQDHDLGEAGRRGRPQGGARQPQGARGRHDRASVAAGRVRHHGTGAREQDTDARERRRRIRRRGRRERRDESPRQHGRELRRGGRERRRRRRGGDGGRAGPRGERRRHPWGVPPGRADGGGLNPDRGGRRREVDHDRLRARHGGRGTVEARGGGRLLVLDDDDVVGGGHGERAGQQQRVGPRGEGLVQGRRAARNAAPAVRAEVRPYDPAGRAEGDQAEAVRKVLPIFSLRSFETA